MTRTHTEARRVLVACHAWYGDTLGGAFRLASEFAAYLASVGHQVDYVCCGNSNALPASELRDGVHIHRYAPPGIRLPGFLKLAQHLSRCSKLIRKLAKQAPYHAASMHSPLQASSCLTALGRSHTRQVYTVHSPFDDEISGNHHQLTWTRRLAVRRARQIEVRNCQRSDVVHTLSDYTANLLGSKTQDKIRGKCVISPGWANATSLQPTSNQVLPREQLPVEWHGNSPLFFTLRRLENRMGLETLVEASRLLHERGVRFRTLIAGGGNLRESLQEQIDRSGLQDLVKLLGRLPEEQLPLAYAAADCFVLPTRALECFGLIVLEAFACNTPVIASNVAAIPELAERQGRDWMFEPGDAEQLANRMQAFIEKKLQPTVDLRAIALEYDKPKILAEWERILLGPPS